MKRIKLFGVLLALMALGLALPGTVRAQDSAPANFDGYLVYMANGQYDPSVPNAASGAKFQSEIMGRSEADVAAELQRAEAFFRDTYGIDFTSVDAVEGVKTADNATFDTAGFMVDPRIEYRAYTIAGRDVPAEGWVVRDGGWSVVIGDGGAVLNGAWGGDEGVEVPAGSIIVFGDYNIDTGEEPILIH